jgi:hypothetical protein
VPFGVDQKRRVDELDGWMDGMVVWMGNPVIYKTGNKQFPLEEKQLFIRIQLKHL